MSIEGAGEDGNYRGTIRRFTRASTLALLLDKNIDADRFELPAMTIRLCVPCSLLPFVKDTES